MRPTDAGEVHLLFKSEELQHSFNFPYQLGPQSSDRPDDADIHTMTVQAGDIVILGTDGLFDNFDEKSIVDVVSKNLKGLASPSDLSLPALAQSIANEAYKVSQNKKAMSPFSRNALAHGYRFIGGKPDDITVLVSRVSTVGEVAQRQAANTSSASTPKESAQSTQNNNKMTADDSDSQQQPSLLQRFLGMRPWTLAGAKL